MPTHLELVIAQWRADIVRAAHEAFRSPTTFAEVLEAMGPEKSQRLCDSIARGHGIAHV